MEYKKISNNLGVIKGELIQNKKMILNGSMTCFSDKSEEGFDWDILKNGESYVQGYNVDLQEEKIGSMIKQGFKKGIKEGKIPFISNLRGTRYLCKINPVSDTITK